MVVRRGESESRTASCPGCLSVKKFDLSWGVRVEENVVAFLCTNEAVGVRGRCGPPTA